MNDKTQPTESETTEPRPNETGGFYFSTFVKITDPETKEVLVQTRGD